MVYLRVQMNNHIEKRRNCILIEGKKRKSRSIKLKTNIWILRLNWGLQLSNFLKVGPKVVKMFGCLDEEFGKVCVENINWKKINKIIAPD